MIKLRPHHLLCASLYVGKGYTNDFCDNFSQVLKRLNKGEAFVLVEGFDDLCAFCPAALKQKNICASQQKVVFYDESILSLLNLRHGVIYSYQKILNIIKENLPFALDYCINCQWQSVCREVVKKYE